MSAARLLAEPEGALFGGELRERLLRSQLEPLAEAVGRSSAVAKDGLQVVPARLVGGHDRECLLGIADHGISLCGPIDRLPANQLEA
jgi:hypothetical protein